MSEDIKVVRCRFIEYSDEFNKLKPECLVRFFHFPSLLITPKIIGKPMNNEQDVLEVFTPFMGLLKKENFTRSELHLDTLTQKILDEYTAIVSGAATRYKKDTETDSEVVMEKIGVTYTFRKDKDNIWKIIGGIIHKPETAIALSDTSE